MEYTALYRRFRPTTFDKVIGQEHITTTLVNQIKSGRIAHAYLFTGSRGVGKTSAARIFSRAINCVDSKNGSPCGKCAACKALEKDNLDVTEIDAASNNGVDDARDLREKVKYPPINCKYKVYIIDEVHMLSSSAFNALLKTLEEPPAHAVFVLCTTEAHKLPATILSRCQRYDFRLVSRDKLVALLKEIYDEVGKKYEDEALSYIAAAAEGSVRDCLSIADLCLNVSETLTAADVLSVMGAGDWESVFGLIKEMAKADFSACLKSVDALLAKGKSAAVVAKDICSAARDAMLIKTAPELYGGTEESRRSFLMAEKELSLDFLVTVIEIFSALDAELRYSVSPRIVLETACVRACKLAVVDIAAISERLDRLERRLSAQPVGAAPVQSVETKSDAPLNPQKVWGRLITEMRKNESMRIQSLVGNHSDVAILGNTLVVYANNENYLEFCDEAVFAALERGLVSAGFDLRLKIEKKLGEVDMDEEILKIKKLVGNKVPVNIKNK